MKSLRPYQEKLKDQILSNWLGYDNIIAQLSTGGGKTVIFSNIIQNFCNNFHTFVRNVGEEIVVIAHRKEILNQIAGALADNGVEHKIIGPENFVRSVRSYQRVKFGRCFVNPYANVTVASVDTLVSRMDSHTMRAWGKTVCLWVQDESHHVLKNNKWGKVAELFPNAKGLGVTATPIRADNRSLHRKKDGLFDVLVQGPSMRWLIDQEYLKDYRIFSPGISIDTSDIKLTGSGDYSPKKLAIASSRSHIVGDVVESYLQFAPGELGVTFSINVDDANHIADNFKANGIPAEVLTAKSTIEQRLETLTRFEARETLQLVNVDLLGEGFDLPAIQVVTMARPTASYGLFCQQFGRVLRPFPGVRFGKVIDHVGNVVGEKGHGLPDRVRYWDLETGRCAAGEVLPPLKTCIKCRKVWEGYQRTCPHCGFSQPIQERGTIEQVKGSLEELDPQILKQLRGEVARVDSPANEIAANMERAGAPAVAVNSFKMRHKERQVSQKRLRDLMAIWAAHRGDAGIEDDGLNVRFYQEFGVDKMTAQTLGGSKVEELINKIREELM